MSPAYQSKRKISPGLLGHPLSILDDHSRYAVGLYALPELSGEQADPYLVETFRRYGVPQAMLMDHGTLGEEVRHRGAPRRFVEWPASQAAGQRLSQEADEFVCLDAPAAFYAIAQFYDDFSQVSDEEVQTLLERSARLAAPSAA